SGTRHSSRRHRRGKRPTGRARRGAGHARRGGRRVARGRARCNRATHANDRTQTRARQDHGITPITLTINGAKVSAAVEPRTHLADFLREQLLLTGTHLGCEHNVCGACTILLDNEPARAYIVYATTYGDHNVHTIENLADN